MQEIQEITNDLRIIGAGNWWNKTQERGIWGQIVEEAKAHAGL